MSNMIKKLENDGLLVNLEELDLGKNYGVFLKIGIVSETIGFFINRNNSPTELTSEEFEELERLVVPAQKWRGAERSYLLSELRKTGDKIIPKDYRRNMVEKKSLLKNPSSLIFGDSSTGTGSEAAGLASRMFYDWAYSYEPLAEISTRYQHNTLSEEGTILHEDNGTPKSNALYTTPYVRPGVKLIRYISMENCSYEMLLLGLIAITGTSRYGARTAILGDNFRNKVIAIGFSKKEAPISSFSTMMESWKSKEYDPEKLVYETMKKAYGNDLLEGEELKKVMGEVNETRSSREKLETIGQQLIAKMEINWKEFFK